MMKLVLGSDHGGFLLKEYLKKELSLLNHEVEDRGCFSENSVDYPDIAHTVCNKVLAEKSLGILICGTGIGISIAANKVPGIRAALCHNEFTAIMSRKHNDANILCLGGRVLGTELAKSIVLSFLEGSFEGGRHEARIQKLECCS